MRSTSLRVSMLLAGTASLALMTQGSAFAADADASGAAASVDEVVVTATKRPEKVRDVVGAVSAMSGEQLQAMGAQSLQDYIGNVPGVVFNNYQPGNSPIVVRGVSTTTYQDQGQPTTGYYINDIPLAEPGFSIMIPDIDTFDLKDVEVLRGPQGTLFGSASLGGLINYITNTADPSGFHAAAESTLNGTYHAQDAGYDFKGMVNIPVINDKLAVRIVGLYRDDPGYVDNIGTGVKGANTLITYGGRVSIVWTPTDKTTVSWLSMYERIKVEDGNYVIPGTLTRDNAVGEAQTSEVEVHSIKLEQDVGFANLTAIGAYAHKHKYVTFDDSIYYPGYLGGTLFPSPEEANSDSEYAEVRLASKAGEHLLDWIVGGNYYTTRKQDYSSISTVGATDYINDHPDEFGGPDMGDILAPNNEFYRYNTFIKGKEYAAFGEATLHPIRQISLTAGGRLFRTTSDDTLTQLPGTTGPAFNFRQISAQSGFSPKGSISYKPSDDFMVYGLISKGYRFGGPNPVPPSAIYKTPLTYGSDSLVNYEIGVRTTWFDKRLELDATAFYVDWTNIQVRLFRPDGFAYVVNAGGAHNEGVELTGLLHVTHNFQVSTNTTYLDAHLSQDVLQCQGCSTAPIPAGTTLPGASKWQTMNIATYTFDGPLRPTLMMSYRYVSRAPVALQSVTTMGGYGTVGARFTVSVRPDLDVSIYGENLNNSHGVLAGPFADFVPAVVILRPRTIGLTLAWKQ